MSIDISSSTMNLMIHGTVIIKIQEQIESNICTFFKKGGGSWKIPTRT